MELQIHKRIQTFKLVQTSLQIIKSQRLILPLFTHTLSNGTYLKRSFIFYPFVILTHYDFCPIKNRLTGQDNEVQLNFLNNWLRVHIEDSQTILKKPLLFAEFGKTSKGSGYTPQQRDILFNTVYSSIFSSARGGGVAAGGLFWQLLAEGMDSLRDGYEIIFSESPSVSDIIMQQSRRLNKIRKMYARLKNIDKWKRARERIKHGN